LGKLTANKAFQNLFKKTIFNQIDKDFGEFIDASARVKPASLHHVYEWNKVGQETSRLFKLNKMDADGLSFRVTYDFKLSKSAVPSKNKKQKNRNKNKYPRNSRISCTTNNIENPCPKYNINNF
jgi:hypothetical protein